MADPVRARAPVRPVHARHRTWIAAAVIVVALLACAVVLRKPIADRMWQGAHIQALLDQGHAALAQGHLTAADGSGARQRFEAALALDNDRGEARTGLAQVGQAAVAQAHAALQANDLPAAQEALTLARQLQVPRAQSDAIASALRKRQADRAGVGALIAQAVAAREAGHLDGDPGAALPLLRQILTLQPDNTIALEAREDLLSDQLATARRDIQAGRLAEAARAIEQARTYDPGHYDLPETRAELSRVLERERERARADAALRGGRLEQAVATYRRVLEASPEDGAATLGLQNAAALYAQRAARRAADFDFAPATEDLAQAQALAPNSQAVGQAEAAIDRARRSQARLDQTTPATPQRRRQIGALLAAAARAEARGDWIDPPGESAFDKLRAAQALAPDDAEVRRAAQRLLPDVRRCVGHELAANRVRAAQGCLDAWQALSPGDEGLTAARRQLAMRWIDIGTERLGAGELGVAGEALQRARGLDRNAPGLADFASRVAHARAGGG